MNAQTTYSTTRAHETPKGAHARPSSRPTNAKSDASPEARPQALCSAQSHLGPALLSRHHQPLPLPHARLPPPLSPRLGGPSPASTRTCGAMRTWSSIVASVNIAHRRAPRGGRAESRAGRAEPRDEPVTAAHTSPGARTTRRARCHHSGTNKTVRAPARHETKRQARAPRRPEGAGARARAAASRSSRRRRATRSSRASGGTRDRCASIANWCVLTSPQRSEGEIAGFFETALCMPSLHPRPVCRSGRVVCVVTWQVARKRKRGSEPCASFPWGSKRWGGTCRPRERLQQRGNSDGDGIGRKGKGQGARSGGRQTGGRRRVSEKRGTRTPARTRNRNERAAECKGNIENARGERKNRRGRDAEDADAGEEGERSKRYCAVRCPSKRGKRAKGGEKQEKTQANKGKEKHEKQSLA